MTLIIENGSNVANANSFNTDAELTAYASARGLELPATEAERNILQTLAMDFINDSEDDMQGYRVTSDQELSFPRTGVTIHGYLNESNKIPVTLKKAQNEASIAAYSQTLLTNSTTNNIQKEKVDVIETTYFKGGSISKVRLDRVWNYLNPVLNPANKLMRT